ncbi:MAG: SMC-Scp complex subunit ScpB, partial [Candidatus Rokubacteria bacterium]|nr:SMC-Scp complex subunit ScpB [Candidatus Rokubacteria bacterium]
GIQLRTVGNGWRMHTHPAYASCVEKLLLASKRARLTRAAVETLAIIAYLQPITRSQIANLRGVQSENVVRVLVEMGLVAEAGKEKALPGGKSLPSTAANTSRVRRLGVRRSTTPWTPSATRPPRPSTSARCSEWAACPTTSRWPSAWSRGRRRS